MVLYKAGSKGLIESIDVIFLHESKIKVSDSFTSTGTVGVDVPFILVQHREGRTQSSQCSVFSLSLKTWCTESFPTIGMCQAQT